MDVTTVNFKEDTVVGGEILHTTFEKGAEEIVPFWDHVRESKLLETMPNPTSDCPFAVYTNFTDTSYDLLVGVPISDPSLIKPPLATAKIHKGNYAQLRVEGKMPDAIIEAWAFIWSPEFPYKRAFTTDYEVYLPDNSVLLSISIK